MLILGSVLFSLGSCGGAVATIPDDTSDTASDTRVDVPWRVVSCDTPWGYDGWSGACDAISAELVADEVAMDHWTTTVLQYDAPITFDVAWESEDALVGWLSCGDLGREFELQDVWTDESGELFAQYEVRVPAFTNDSPSLMYCVAAVPADSWTDLTATLTETPI